MSCSAFLFDLDGTLVDTKHDIAKAVNVTLKELGLNPLPEETIYGYIGNGARLLMERSILKTGSRVSPEDLERALGQFLSFYSDHLLDSTTLFPGIEAVLSLVRGKFCAIISNKPHEFCERVLKGLKIRDIFNTVSGGTEGASRKPDPGQILKILKDAGIPPLEAVMTGDSVSDIFAGKRAGTLTAGVLWGLNTEESLLEAGTDFIARTPENLYDIFTNLMKG